MAKKIAAPSAEEIIARALPEVREQRRAARQAAHAAVRAMSREVERCQETLAHHLLDLPFWKVLYYWAILRLKYRPWRILIPVSLFAVAIYRLAAGTIPNLWALLAGGLVP